jgi:uncharacterized protein YfiM (DUF2279 family)
MGNRKANSLFLLIVLIALNFGVYAQHNHDTSSAKDSIPFNPARLRGVVMVQGGLYVASIAGLYYAWYKDSPQSSFHFFNDNGEWLQMDKCGHFTASNYISRIGYMSYRWAGLDEKRSAWFGGLLSFAYMLNIELLDGFSTGWGFSAGDLAANTIGSSMFVAQQIFWHQQKFVMKFSFHQTEYAALNQELLGKNLMLQMLKDYNGQSFWLSGNISSFLPGKPHFPGWLNVALGYGAEGMVAAVNNGTNPDQIAVSGTPVRKFLLSVDIDFSRIRTKSQFLRTLLNVINFIKVPAPAIEYNTSGQWKFYGLYF